MFKKHNLIEINNEDILLTSFYKMDTFKKVINLRNSIKDQCIYRAFKDKKLCVDLKNKNIHFLIKGKKVFIKMITVPKVHKKHLKDIIKGELDFYFENIENLVYCYSVFKEEKDTLEIVVFCSNLKELDMFNNLKEKNNIEGIWFLQFCFLEYFYESIKEENFILASIYEKDLYLLACKNKKLVHNHVVNNYENNFKEELNKFLYKCKELEKEEYKVLYLINFEDMEFVKEMEKRYKIIKLGPLGRHELIKKFS
ncbi:hypothetical protein K144313037_14090 [Clostridium tetani]|uniref:Conserved protein n=1 Tax=Clostridium tetani (strain Massachusetts / E88) TaxID=212717 RepID=Q894F0_CLOTE|nr:hypothetical protein [Clostridium tetani]AAO36142.1 conserved protein [Clostridium tetani E88]AVP54138.1 hypothetical protein C3B72_03010 [Clostridium tetani]KGI37899.1 hypothetical protein KY52_10200 [Clostridium tetani]KGI45378.1 hypothetical protein KY54_04560 [Clostridium tetani]KHO31683.1 hypothetical protein OR63_08175 [Clostridium tetani]